MCLCRNAQSTADLHSLTHEVWSSLHNAGLCAFGLAAQNPVTIPHAATGDDQLVW